MFLEVEFDLLLCGESVEDFARERVDPVLDPLDLRPCGLLDVRALRDEAADDAVGVLV